MATLAALGGAATAQEAPAGKILPCRGVEESGRLIIGQPGFGPHLISLFVTGPNPLSATQTTREHLAWVNDPLHSYVADGTGGLCIWAHPAMSNAAAILALDGLTGIEVAYAGDGSSRDELWDVLLTGCYDAQRPFLWAFAADDTHSRQRIDLSWFAALLPEVSLPALKQALRAGAFYVSNGPTIEGVQVAGSTLSLRLGQDADVFWLRAGQFISSDRARQEWSSDGQPGANHCLQSTPNVRSAALDLAALPGWPASIRFVRAVVRVGADRVALTQPWRVGPDGSIANPYPSAGNWVRGQTHNHTDTGPDAPSGLGAFRLAYREKGQLASFATDYSYWESPHQWLPEDGTPQVLAVTPARVPQGSTAELLIRGLNFTSDATVQAGPRLLQLTGDRSATELRVILPGDLPPATYDLAVTNPDHLRGTLAPGLTVASRTTQGTWRNYTTANGLAFPHSTCVARVGDEVWVGSVRGISRFAKGQWNTLTAKGEPGRMSAYAMLGDPAGGLWIAGGSGLACRDGAGTWQMQTVGQTDKLKRRSSPERWGRMAFDRDGNLWVANRWGMGLGVRRGGTWERLTVQHGIPSDSQSAVACDTTGKLWIGFGNGLHRFEAGKWLRLSLPAPLASCSYVSALAPGPDGVLWAAVSHGEQPELGGVLRVRAAEVTAYTSADCGLPSARIRDLLIARDGSVWFASDLGLACLSADGRQWQTFTAVNSDLACDIVLGLAEDAAGSIWCATAAGASCLERPQ